MASGQLKPLLKNRPAPENGAGFSWLTVLGFAFLTFNSVMAEYSSNRDLGAVGFVALSLPDLVSLFYCLRRYSLGQV
jgi:hypothetical protein